MKETNIMKRLQKEIEEAIKYNELLGNAPETKYLKGYVVGIRFAIDLIITGKAKSILNFEEGK